MFGSAAKVMLAPVFFDINRLRFAVLAGPAITVFGIACAGPEVIELGFRCFLGVYLLSFYVDEFSISRHSEDSPPPLNSVYMLY